MKVYNASGVQGRAQTLTDTLARQGLQHAGARQPRQAAPGHRGRVRRRVRARRPGARVVRRRRRRDRAGVSRPIRPRARPTPTASSSSAPRSARRSAAWPSRGRSSRSSTIPRAPRCSSTSTARWRRSCSTRPRRGRCRRRAPRWPGSSRCSARVAVVSGRPAAFLRDALAIDGLDYVGTYGLERIVARRGGARRAGAPVRRRGRAGGRRSRGRAARAAGRAQGRGGGHGALARPARAGRRRHPLGRRGRAPPGARGTAARAAWRWSCVRRCRSTRARPSPSSRAACATAAAFAGDDAGDLPAFAALHALVDDGTLAHGGEHRRHVGREPARGARRRRRGRGSGGVGGAARRARRRDRRLAIGPG